MITLEIDSVDRTTLVNFGSLVKQDNVNEIVDVVGFTIDYHAGQTFRPEANSAIEIFDGATLIFAGSISRVTKRNMGVGKIRYFCNCKDKSYDLDRVLYNDSHEDIIVNDLIDLIIAFVNTETGLSFTTNNVDCDIVITKIAFARVQVSECLQRLSDLTGFSFYIDYEGDIHFFIKNTEVAPFNIADGDGNHITDSLSVTDDFTQIRNRIFIKGAEIEGEERTETYQGDGTRKSFPLANKFASKPTVEVDSVSKTVGIDFLDIEADFDCFWDFTTLSLRFKDSTIPGAVDVEVTGIPLFVPEFQVEDPISIGEHGVFEFAKTDKSIESREQAVGYAKAQIEAYRNGVIEGEFVTYTGGLRSGQVITVTSTLMNVSEDFLIQSVIFTMITPTEFEYQIRLATLRTIGIIDFLLGLIRTDERILESEGEVVIEKTVFPKEDITIGDVAEINTNDLPQIEDVTVGDSVDVQALDFPLIAVAGPYIPDPTNPSDFKRVFITNGSKVG